MIDFNNAKYLKRSPVNNKLGFAKVSNTFKTIRMVIFSNKRIVAINIQGISGKKKDYTTLSYSKIQSFYIETAGTLALLI